VPAAALCPVSTTAGVQFPGFRLSKAHDAGRVFSREDLEFIAQLCIEHNVYVLADEGAALPCLCVPTASICHESHVQHSVQQLKHHPHDGGTVESAMFAHTGIIIIAPEADRMRDVVQCTST